MLNLRERDPSEYGADPLRSRGGSPPSVAVGE
jgi:hypothetical protein